VSLRSQGVVRTKPIYLEAERHDSVVDARGLALAIHSLAWRRQPPGSARGPGSASLGTTSLRPPAESSVVDAT